MRPAPKGRKVFRASKARWAAKEAAANKDPRAVRGHKAAKDRRGHKAILALQEPRALLDHRDRRDRRATQDLQGRKDLLETMAVPALPDR